jgi:hypothetical protein
MNNTSLLLNRSSFGNIKNIGKILTIEDAKGIE